MLGRLLGRIFARRAATQSAHDHAQRCAQLIERGELESALACCARARAEHPGDVALRNLEARVLYLRGDEARAIEHLYAAVRADPFARDARFNLAQLLYERRALAAALEQLDAALALDPDDVTLRLLRAGALLSLGDYARGFAEYEHRWARVAVRARRFIFERPRWDGREPLAGRRLLVHAEQGFGDTLQFVRYVPLLVEHGAHVVVQCHTELVRLLRGLHGVAGVFAKGETLPPFDLQIPMGSLPLAFGTTLGTVPGTVPYLVADAAERARWRGRRNDAALHIGLAWKSNSASSDARNKSVALGTLAPVLAVDSARFVSLQLGGREEAAAAAVADWTEEFSDFAAAAALVAELDLVITIDSAVAHLAGALGRPTWVLLPHLPDWRWLMEGKTTPWYPTARLFRQERRGDWSAPIARVAAELAVATRSIPAG